MILLYIKAENHSEKNVYFFYKERGYYEFYVFIFYVTIFFFYYAQIFFKCKTNIDKVKM